MMKAKIRLLAGLAAVTIAGSASMAGAVCSGDIVAPHPTLTINDVSALLKCVGNKTSPPTVVNPALCGVGGTACGGAGILSCGDVNLDGAITTADAVLLAKEVSSPGSNPIPLCASAGPTVTCGTALSGHITTNEVLDACEYFINGTTFVDPGHVLTVRPGAIVRGQAAAATPSALVFLAQGTPSTPNCLVPATSTTFTARINAAGTPSKPIVFTSDQPVGSRAAGDWGGVAFNGCSLVNVTGGQAQAEGLNGVLFGGGTDCVTDSDGVARGGTANCQESSGLMRYTRIEFAGNELSPDNELNVLTQNGLGDHTKFTFLQANAGLDDGFEWFGGNIQEKYFVATGNRDDNFDWQLGNDNKLQYGVAAQYLPNLDSLGDNGFEGDNNENGFNNLSVSTPQFCNITVIGSRGQGTHPSGGAWVGTFLRRGTAGQIAKSIVTNFQTGGLQFRDKATALHACTGLCTAPAARAGGSGDGVTACTTWTTGVSPTLVDTNATHKVCATGTNVGLACTTDNPDCPDAAQPGGFSNCRPRQDLLVRNTLFYNNGTTGIAHAVNKSGGNNTNDACNSTDFFTLLQADPTLKIKANAVVNDPAFDPGIQAGPFWPPISFKPQNAALVKDDPAIDGFNCSTGFNTFFDQTTYMGGIDPNGTDWTQTPGGWISYQEN